MKISESYFKDLLFRTEAIDAVSKLDCYLCTHLDRGEPILLGLSEPERHVHLCLIYTGEVGNGGHSQFFLNRGGNYTERALIALQVMGFSDLQGCLEGFSRKQSEQTIGRSYRTAEPIVERRVNYNNKFEDRVFTFRIDHPIIRHQVILFGGGSVTARLTQL